jgi:hypothetical protein
MPKANIIETVSLRGQAKARDNSHPPEKANTHNVPTIAAMTARKS